MTNIHIPIRRIMPEEILEFLEWLIEFADIEIDNQESSKHVLTIITLEASLGELIVSVAAENRGLAALTQLKWGKGVDEHPESVKPEMNKGGTDDFEDC